ncbi:MAG: hypothetical protein DMG06_30850, partial [Acidobacteria bacterium]
MSNQRLPPRETQTIDTDKTITFTFDNRTVSAFAGDTIGSALYAAGVRVFSRSFKYHRPRGLFCVDGKCPNCLMNVNGCPNVRICTEPVNEGDKVRHQNAWPSLELDFLSITEKLDRFLPPGFYYKTMINPRFWHVAEPFLRRAAGLGKIDIQARSSHHCEHVYEYCDVAIVGGDETIRIFLIDDQPELGGHLRYSISKLAGPAEFTGKSGREIVRQMADRVKSLNNVTVLNRATVFGCYEGRLLAIMQGNRLIHLRARRLLLAPGRHEIPELFENNDLPGIFLSRGVRRLVNLYGINPGGRVLVVARNDEGIELARELMSQGVHLVGLVDNCTKAKQAANQVGNVPSYRGYQLVKALGKKRVTGAILEKNHLSEPVHASATQGRSRVEIECDVICLAKGWQAQLGLLYQSGCQIGFDESRQMFLAQKIPEDVFIAGEVLGHDFLESLVLSGQIAGLEAVKTITAGARADLESRLDRSRRRLVESSDRGNGLSVGSGLSSGGPWETKKQFVCLCEDITGNDLSYAVDEGFDEIETLKRYSTISMGPCQGKMCSFNSIETCARVTGKGIAETGITTPRPPLQPVPIGLLAGPEHHPIKRTPMHYRHLALG